MVRVLLFLLLTAALARGSDFIPAPKEGVSASVSQPHVTAELISETTHVEGKPFLVALHLHMDPDWHTYWINPGDAGLATTIKWTLPAGFTAGPIQWPTPELHKMGPLTTYGYGGDVYLLTTITPPDKFGMALPVEIKAHADWLVCKEECIPGKGDFTLTLGGSPGDLEWGSAFIATAKARLPVENTLWDVKAGYQARGGIAMPGQQVLVLACSNKPGVPPVELGHTYFFPEQGNVVDPNENNVSKPASDQKFSAFNYILDLQQNGEKAARISGVLVSDRPLIGKSKAVSLAPVATNSNIPPLSWAGIGKVENGGGGALASPIASASIGGENSPARSAAATTEAAASPIEAQPFLIAVLGAAFVGGLILNLMPCVLPVLSLKVFSLIRHAGDESGGAWKQGVAFTVGVVISFWILAGLLIALRAAGDHLGWGFQMQSPGFVLALIFLFFLLGLNLFGVFELGTSLVGLDAKAAGQAGSGLASSFLNGVLATIAATPCTAPFMGSSVGFAAEQPAYIALLIFTVLALGMATPYLLLTIFPGALRFVPKPGAWMEALKQFMGFLLLATVIFLIYVFGALVGTKQIPMVLFCLLLAGIGAWIYGRWGTLRALLYVFALAAGLYALKLDAGPLFDLSSGVDQKAEAANGWQPWTTGAVNRALTQKRPVFVDFTAAWCLSCKVNEQLALETDEVRQAFTRKNVALFRADWTHSDPKISEVLAQYHRDGVPLYLLYAPGEENSPQVLPEVLTPGIVVNALERLP